MRGKGRPQPDEPPAAQAGTRMLVIPDNLNLLTLAEESIENLKRERPPRIVKTSKRKRRSGVIGAPRG
jgi:hypothetical protein